MLTLGVAVGTLVLTVFLYIVIPKGFFPVQDTGLIQLITEGPQSASYEAMVDRQQAVADGGPRATRPSRTSRPSSASTAPTRRSTAAGCS